MKRLSRAACLIAISAAITAVLPQGSVAQTSRGKSDAAPLSVIDWLGTQAPLRTAQPKRKTPKAPKVVKEPAVSKSAAVPEVTAAPLGEGSPRAIGIVPSHVTGLPIDIWAGSDVETLARLITGLPDLQLPAAQSLLYTLLLAEAQAPKGGAAAGDALALTRVSKLIETGALDPAMSLIEQTGVATSPDHFDLWMQISLLSGTEDRACDLLTKSPHLTRDYGTRIFCAARAGKWDNAALTFGSAQALGLMNDEKLDLFDRFLHPDGFEGEPPLPAPRAMDPLTFRVFEAIGEPQPTRNLPRAFAVADLRDLAGWKSQLEAAERLTHAGALPDNRLLGLYTDRDPAASGGIWDRVAALQRFDTALKTTSPDAVAKTLPAIWSAMQEAGLEVAFATLFAQELTTIALTGSAATLASDIGLLSPGYETIARLRPENDALRALAQGDAPAQRPEDIMGGAVFDAFATPTPRADLTNAKSQGQLGASILRVIGMLEAGANGDTTALRDALSTLRALGLEDTARRAALQVILLDRTP